MLQAKTSFFAEEKCKEKMSSNLSMQICMFCWVGMVESTIGWQSIWYGSLTVAKMVVDPRWRIQVEIMFHERIFQCSVESAKVLGKETCFFRFVATCWLLDFGVDKSLHPILHISTKNILLRSPDASVSYVFGASTHIRIPSQALSRLSVGHCYNLFPTSAGRGRRTGELNDQSEHIPSHVNMCDMKIGPLPPFEKAPI